MKKVTAIPERPARPVVNEVTTYESSKGESISEAEPAVRSSICFTCSADAMDIILDRERESLIHYEFNFRDIETSSSNICDPTEIE